MDSTADLVDKIIERSDLLLSVAGWRSLRIQLTKEIHNIRVAVEAAMIRPRNGCTLDCGCWFYCLPGATLGEQINCNLHGQALTVKMNVREPANPKVFVHG